MLNHIVIQGRMTRDPELRRTNSGSACAVFTLAVDRDYTNDGKRETDFIECVAWRNTAEFAAKYFVKGQLAIVSGKLNIRKYQDKEGKSRTAAEVVADSVYFSGPKSENAAPNPAAPAQPVSLPDADNYTVMEDDDGCLPF